MIRDVKEIESLATKYSKQQLAHMAQIGMIDPTKAVMAGMMRDRISKEDAKPPTTTVAQDVLGIQSQAQAGLQPDQGQVPQGAQSGVASLPPQQENAGVAALPSNIQSMAGGGIVAFDEGGYVPGYAAGTPTGIQVAGNDPESEERVRLMEREAFARQQAARNKAAADKKAAEQNTSSTVGRAFTDLFGGKKVDENTTQQLQELNKRFQALSARDRELTGQFGMQQQTADQQAEAARVKAEMNSVWQQAQDLKSGKAPPAVVPAPVADAEVPVVPAPPVVEDKKGQRKTAAGQGIVTPNLSGKVPAYDPNAGKIGIGTLAIPTVESSEDIRKARRAAELEEGVDPKMYEKLISGVEEKKGKLEDRKGEAQGNALMAMGLGLMGARRGQEFQTLSESGIKALNSYKEDMKDVRNATEKYDERMETLRMADQQARRTNSAADLAERKRQESLAAAAKSELFKAENEAAKSSGIIAANLHHTNVGAFTAGQQLQVQKAQAQNTAAQQSRMASMYENRMKNADLATQAKMTKLKMDAYAAFGMSPEGTAFMNKLKTDFGDNYLTAPKAKARLAQAKEAYFQSQLARMPEGSFSADDSGIPTPAQLMQAPQ